MIHTLLGKLSGRSAVSGIAAAILLMTISVELSLAQVSPYVHDAQQSIKSLTAKELSDLRSGNGMGFAKTAELNHHPGPRHVLDLANEMSLTKSQKISTQDIFSEMKKQAIKLGHELIEQETVLNNMFATGMVTPKRLSEHLSLIGQIRAKIRYIHLQAHIFQTDILSSDQINQYDELRGYRNSSKHSGEHGNHTMH